MNSQRRETDENSKAHLKKLKFLLDIKSLVKGGKMSGGCSVKSINKLVINTTSLLLTAWSWWRSVKRPTGIMMRWLMDIQEVNPDIKIIRGEENQTADALSRLVELNYVEYNQSQKELIIRELRVQNNIIIVPII